jgi:GntR family transcriptional regulator, transcriptional repressor for pyruvate dehydrogenase complex
MGADVNSLLLRPIRTGNVFEETVERLAHAVRLGVVAPGERLPAERDLAIRLGVSRATIREAVRTLQMAGLIETRRGRRGGSYVVDLASAGSEPRARLVAQSLGAALLDALDYRWSIEPAAAELAAERADPEGIARLRVLAADLEVSHDGPYHALDARFHLAVADLARAPSLAAAVADAQARVAEVIEHIQPVPEALRHSDEQHRALIDAIERGDRAAARAIMDQHISATANLLRGFLV